MSDWRCSRLRPFRFLALAHAGADVALGLRDVKTGGELAREIEAIGRWLDRYIGTLRRLRSDPTQGQ